LGVKYPGGFRGQSPRTFGWFQPVDEPLEDGLERGIVGVGVVTDDVDGAAVAVGGLARIAAGFVDHTEAVVAVMDIGEAREQLMCGLFGGIEIAGLNHVDHCVGRLGQFVELILGSVKNLGLCRKLDCLLLETVIQDRGPDLKHAMGP
jgi:hypothetical protein